MDAPRIDGIHHIKIPVTDLVRSRDWYTSRLGYQVDVVFVEDGTEMGLAMSHPNGGPALALRVNPQRCGGIGDFRLLRHRRAGQAGPDRPRRAA